MIGLNGFNPTFSQHIQLWTSCIISYKILEVRNKIKKIFYYTLFKINYINTITSYYVKYTN